MTASLLSLALFAASPPADSDLKKRAEALVSQLGSADYRDREKAARELLDIGYAAKDAVLVGQHSPDTEISDRCTKLYPAIWRHDLDKRIRKFLDDPDAPIPDDLPGAARWLKVAGDGAKSREMYAEMVKAHPAPLLDVELHPERLKDVYAEFIRSVYARTMTRVPGKLANERPTPTDSEVNLFFFLGAAGDVRPATVLPGTSSSYYYQFLNATSLTARLTETPIRKLYAAWLEKERYSVVLRRGIDVAAQHGIKECGPTVLKIANDAGTSPFIRATALLGFAKLGTKDNIKDLEPFLKDKLQIAAVVVNGERGSVQMRDVAMGAAVCL
ncbi:MAG TPA: hypothetical protein VKD71_00500, partial [Gemmataceae bacterium]|nr:hypothetical protein [Gemmataceae bacterium]